MKLPKPRKLSSGSWFIQLRLGGESVSVTEPTERACIAAARLLKSEHLAGKRQKKITGATLREACTEYVAARSNTLSPATIRGYNMIIKHRFQSVMDIKIKDVHDWQKVCNDEAKLCAPKTLKNAWGFIAPILREETSLPVRITLPQVAPKDIQYMEPEQIKTFVAAVRGKPCEIAALLALHSLRRSEILYLTWDNIDLKNRRLHVCGAAVFDENDKLTYKPYNKNTQSNRFVPILIPSLVDALSAIADKTGHFVTMHPNTLRDHINRICSANGLPLVGVHGLRHSFASLAYHLGVPEKITMQIGGWSDRQTMDKIYTHLAQKDIAKNEQKLSNFFSIANENTNETT